MVDGQVHDTHIRYALAGERIEHRLSWPRSRILGQTVRSNAWTGPSRKPP